MSRQNKVNPGMYTQRGRLTQDDAARELRKQSAIGSPHTWQPVKTKRRPRLAAVGHTARETYTSGSNDKTVETPPQVETRPASRAPRNMTAAKAAPSNAKAKAAKAKTARNPKSKTAAGKAKTGRAKTGQVKTGKAKTAKAKTTSTKRTRRSRE